MMATEPRATPALGERTRPVALAETMPLAPLAAHPFARDVGMLAYLLVGRPWTNLGIVSLGDAKRSWELAQRLVKVARAAGSSPLRAAKVQDLDAERAVRLGRAVQTLCAQGRRFILATGSPVRNPATLHVLETCEAVLLLLEQGHSSLSEAQRTIELVGRGRVIGAVLVSP